jgi:hypothetical protein
VEDNAMIIRTERVPIMMSAEETKSIDNWRGRNGIASRSKAIRQLCSLALQGGSAPQDAPPPPSSHAAAFTSAEIEEAAAHCERVASEYEARANDPPCENPAHYRRAAENQRQEAAQIRSASGQAHVQPVEVCLWLADLILDARLDGRSEEIDPEWTAKDFTQHRAYQRILAAFSPAPETKSLLRAGAISAHPDVDALRGLVTEIRASLPALSEQRRLFPLFEYLLSLLVSQNHVALPASFGNEGRDRYAQTTAAKTITTQITKSSMYVPIIDTPNEVQLEGDTKVPPLEGNGPKRHNSPALQINKRVTVAYAHCCSGSVLYCDCVNKSHGTAMMGENEAGEDYPIVTSSPETNLDGNELLQTIKEFARWHHLNSLTILNGGKPSDSEIDIEATAWNTITRALAATATEGSADGR